MKQNGEGMKKVLCIGDAAYYIIVSGKEGFVHSGAKSKAEQVSIHIGGCASGTAVCLAKLGIETALCCRIGVDMPGRQLIDALSREGVNMQYAVRDPELPTAASVICEDSSGKRSIFSSHGCSAIFEEEDIPGAALNECDIVFIGGVLTLDNFDDARCAWLMRNARKRKKFTVLDTSWDFDGRWMEKAQHALPFLDLFMCSREEGLKLTGKTKPERIADVFFNAGVRSVVIKLGEEGALVCPGGGMPCIRVPAYACKPVDRTGAGDAFAAGMLAGLARDWDFYKSARFANAVSHFCLIGRGIYEGIPSAEEIEAFMQNNEKSVPAAVWKERAKAKISAQGLEQ